MMANINIWWLWSVGLRCEGAGDEGSGQRTVPYPFRHYGGTHPTLDSVMRFIWVFHGEPLLIRFEAKKTMINVGKYAFCLKRKCNSYFISDIRVCFVCLFHLCLVFSGHIPANAKFSYCGLTHHRSWWKLVRIFVEPPNQFPVLVLVFLFAKATTTQQFISFILQVVSRLYLFLVGNNNSNQIIPLDITLRLLRCTSRHILNCYCFRF